MFTCRRRKVLAAHLPAETLAALEQRGPMVVRDQMAKAGGSTGGASFIMHAGLKQDPSRSDVEKWLAEHARADEALATCRHRQVLLWAIAATVAGVVGVLVGIMQSLWSE
jgi:hypothetical protein